MRRLRTIGVLGGAAAVAASAFVAVGSAATPAKLTATVGPGFTITLRNAKGAAVKTLTPGVYRITVSDRSTIHNFRLTGPGVSKATSVPATGTTVWTVTLKAGTYRFVCDPHASSMKGSFTVRAGAPAKLLTANANTASTDQLIAALEAHGVTSADRWAREIEEYRPYPTDDPTFAKLRQELSKYNPSADQLTRIIASLTL